MYEGKLSRLRSLDPEDAALIFKYWNDYEIRQLVHRKGKRHDVVSMDILRSEYVINTADC